MMSLAIDNAATDSMMQLTGQNQFTRSLSGGYRMTNGSCVRQLFFKNRRSHQKKHSKCQVCESTELTVDERTEDGESVVMLNEFHKKQCHI